MVDDVDGRVRTSRSQAPNVLICGFELPTTTSSSVGSNIRIAAAVAAARAA